MKSNSAEIYVFSGSGNTFLLAETAAAILNDNGCPTVLRPLPGDFVPARRDCALGLSFPVACFATYPFVISFLQSLPPGGGREVFFLGSMAGGSFRMEEVIRRLLMAKDYRPVGCQILLMPSNYGKNTSPSSLANKELIKTATDKAANFAGQLLINKTYWHRKTAPWAGLFHRFAQCGAPWRVFRFFFPLKINQASCVKCGFCRKICPAGAIEERGGAFFIKDNCVSCQHCAAFCPQSAISIGGKGGACYRVVEYDRISGGLRR